ncbi:MAG TPA: hypothetical protein VK530_03665, partial [Candidatus Acidoferrum sp.]|nr:hypothetical protein [Candidatus Acidoferrum sp.]
MREFPSPVRRLANFCSAFLLLIASTHAAQVITSVTETGGDGTVLAQWTGNSFTGIAPLGAYTVPPFGNHAKVFVDRSHAWTNATAAILIPPYLVGHDYIMARNDSRENTGFRLAVTVAQDVIVYMLVDNRIGDTTANNNNPPFNATDITAWTGMTWMNTNGFRPVLTGRNRTSNATLPDEVGIDENADNTINNHFSIYSNRFPAGTFTLYQQGLSGNNMYGVVVAIAPALVPVVRLVAPATNNFTFHHPTNGLVFNLTATSAMDTNTIKLVLNGVDVSSSLVITGSTLNATTAFNGLASNTIYSGSLTVTNAAGPTVFNFSFDTFIIGAVTVIEAEDYNYGDGECQPATPTNPLESTVGGSYFNDPAPGQYLNALGAIDIDYHHLAASRGDAVTNVFRICDFVGTKVSGDDSRAPFPGSGFADHDVWQIQTGEWLNYTRDIPAGTYHVYLRAISTANNSFQLDRVTGDVSTTSQTPNALGTFSVPNTSGGYNVVPLRNGLGQIAVIALNGSASTLRLTALNAGANVQANFLVLVPLPASVPPTVATVSPAAGATGVYPDATVSATIANGSTAVNVGSIVLRFNGADVTADATVAGTAGGANVFYDPPGFLPVNSTNVVSLEFLDDAITPASFTNAWSFSTLAVLPIVPATFATAFGSATDAGFNLRIRKASNTAPAATFPASIIRAEQHLADQVIDPTTSAPYVNEATPGAAEIPTVLNFEQSTNVAGVFTVTNGYPDSTYPYVPAGDPRWTNEPNYISIEATAYLELNAGVHRFAVRSDDGFKLTVGPILGDTNLVLGFFDAGRGDAASEFDFLVVSNGVYAFRLLYFEATGGSSL